ncbi:GWT1-domain-containing protein [Backusella circina FSU 941]|nr:GWT1-domain-containing protein [Backusella circina FSU 941]
MTEDEYRLAKEAHVSNCTGGSIAEINILCGSLVSSHLLWCSLVKAGYIKPASYFAEFAIYVLPALFCTTLASEYVNWVTFGLALMGFLIPTKTQQVHEKENVQFKSYLTVYRAGTMILTCIAILAVDFQVFPRRFAKVETFGTSLMDVGVGSFVFSSGIVASRAYIKRQRPTVLMAVFQAIRSAFPVLVLGFARLFLTKSVNYQEHNSEYGLHWNFFFTLGFLPPFVTLLGFLRRFLPFSILAFLIAAGYQTALCLGLQTWILEAARVDLITANKEGICSFLGYLSIFLFGLECGTIVFQDAISASKLSRILNISQQPIIKQTALQLYVYSGALWVLFYGWIYLSPDYYVSRRMANLPYIFWVVAFNVTLLASIVFIESYRGVGNRGPALLDSININGLVVFLVANVLTGAVNLSMQTLYMTDNAAMMVNLVYISIVTAVAWHLWRSFSLRIKL